MKAGKDLENNKLFKSSRFLRYGAQLAIAALICLFSSGDQIATEVSSTFVQTDWSAGASSDTASHLTNRTGWAKYSSKGTYIGTSQADTIKLTPESFTITDTLDTDFLQGTMDKVVCIKPALVVGTNTVDYKCIKGHTSSENTRPVSGGAWSAYWVSNGTTGQGAAWTDATNYLLPIVSPGTGVDADLQVTSFVADPFASILGEWLTLPSIPYPGRFTTYAKAGKIIYVLFASGDGKQFGKYDTTTCKWTMLAPLPRPASAGSCIAWDGEVVIALRGEGSKEVYKYVPGDDLWSTFTNLTAGVNFGSSIVATGGTLSSGTGRLYLLLGGITKSFVCYNPTYGVWLSEADAPATVEEGGQLAYIGTGDYIYACRGQQTTTFWRYKISTNTWYADVPSAPKPAEDTNTGTYGGQMWRGSRIWGAGNYVYMAMAYNCFNSNDLRNYQTFWRIGPISDSSIGTWQRLADCPDYTDENAFIMYSAQHIVVGSNGNDYRCILNHTAAAANMPISGANWTTYWVANGTTGQGSAWVSGQAYSTGTKIELLSAKNLSRPWEYDLTTDQWREVTQNINGGLGCNNEDVIYIKNTPGYTDYIYMIYDVQFWRYKISTNSWQRMANSPYRQCRSRSLADLNGYLYLLRGESTLNWARYDLTQTPGSDVWVTLPDFPQHPDQSDSLDRKMHNGCGIVGVISSSLATRTQDIVHISGNGTDYKCIKSHWADSTNKPTTGANWATYWVATGTSWQGATWTSGNAYSNFNGTAGHDKFICAWRGQDMNYFYRIDVYGDPATWVFSRGSDLPWSSLCGGYMVWPGPDATYGDNDVIYAMYGHNSYEFRKYYIKEDVWTTTNLNGPLEGLYESGGSCSAPLVNDGTSRYLYYTQTRCCEYYAWRWQRFDMQTELWEELPALPFLLVEEIVWPLHRICFL